MKTSTLPPAFVQRIPSLGMTVFQDVIHIPQEAFLAVLKVGEESN